MAIIKPSRQFEGSDMSNGTLGTIVKSDVRLISFKEEKNKEGVYLFILPPYKVDGMGHGVWYKVVNVRDNFGLDVKERFPEGVNCPVSHFASQCKLLFPDYASVKTLHKDGKDQKVYPSFGRITKRVLFNVTYCVDPSQVFVLDVPQFGCADVIDNYHRGRLPDGSQRNFINDPEAAVAVQFRLKKGGIGNPWEVQVESSKTYALPEQLTDSDNVYNLDEVLAYRTSEELVDRLRKITPADIFDECMKNYRNGGPVMGIAPSHNVQAGSVSQHTSFTGSQPKAIAPVFNIAPRKEEQSQVEPVVTSNVSNPVQVKPTSTKVNISEAKAFLRQ